MLHQEYLATATNCCSIFLCYLGSEIWSTQIYKWQYSALDTMVYLCARIPKYLCKIQQVFVQNTTSICMKYQKYFCWHCITSQSNQQGNSAKRNTKGICVLEYQSICVKYKKSICNNAKKYLCVEIVLQVATQSRRQLGQTACRCRAI